MKNLQLFVHPSEISNHVMGLWKTDIFRNSHANGEFVGKLVDQFAWMPRLFAQESNDHLERAHFSTWWNVIMMRDNYTNPYIHDLYYLHEIAHAASMPYLPNIGRMAFDEKMVRNELEASVLSEILVYFEMPGLRECSFDHAIYADDFLFDPGMQKLWAGNKQVAIETIRTKRRDIMVSRDARNMSKTEKWIRRFAEQNQAYSVTWTRRYNEIEIAMAALQLSDNPIEAGKYYHRWLVEEAQQDPIDNIPFREEAELFSPFYWANKAHYDADMAKAR